MRILGGVLIIIIAIVSSAGVFDGHVLNRDGDSTATDHDGIGSFPFSLPGNWSQSSLVDPEDGDGNSVGEAGAPPDDDRCVSADPEAESVIRGLTVIVDPGHGGEDLGTVNEHFSITESELVLGISRLLRDRITELGAHACLTRDSDRNLALRQRAELANRWRGDVFVSIHLNHLSDPNEDYTMTMWGTEAKDRFLAETLLPVMAEALATPESYDGNPNPMSTEVVRLEDLDSSMLRSADMPAVLVEAAFLSNPWEARAFIDGIDDGTRWREHQIADALRDGLLAYFSAFN